MLEQVHSGTGVLLNYGSKQEKVLLSRIFPALDIHALGTAEADLNSMPFGLPSGARIPARVTLASVDNELTIPHQAIVEMNTSAEKKGFIFKVVENEHNKPTSNSSQKTLQRIVVDIILNAHKALAISSPNLSEGDEVIIAHESVLLQLEDNDTVLINNTNNDELSQ